MKNFALVIAFALLASVPASAAEICKAAPVTTLEQQAQEAIPLFAGFMPVLVPRCYALEGTSCQTAGSTTACTDACSNHLSCTCYNYYGGTYHNILIGRYWDCNDEC